MGDNEYLIEIEVDTEGINEYDIIDVTTGENVGHMEYDNLIRYTISKEQLKEFKIDFRKNFSTVSCLSFKIDFNF